ncbi:MAG: hypothetical protein ACLQF0_07685 [Dissulfurispiraceae bacterium]
MTIFSTPEQLQEIKKILSGYIRLPFSDKTIPGAVMEAVLAKVRNGVVLNTYDFVDVINAVSHCGWQVKSTKEKTPVTWKRAKLPNQDELIKNSHESKEGLQALGDTIIDFCNAHVRHSIELYDLREIGYSRLIVHKNWTITYFEKLLCVSERPDIFAKADFSWKWSIPKKTKKKEQLPALHGTHKTLKKKWWAWHGLGENQLHFSGERAWWPTTSEGQMMTFDSPADNERILLERFVDFLAKLDNSV